MSWSSSRVFVALVIGACLAFATPGVALAQEYDGLWLRVGGVLEGPQHSLRKGLELGGGWDWHLSPALAFGVGAGFARQGSQFQYSEFEAQFLSFEGHVRRTIGRARVRPLAEFGLGYYLFDGHSRYQPASPEFKDDWRAPGVWFGIGAEAKLTESVAARLGIAYHAIAQGVAVEGGNMEDYFAGGVTLEYGLRRH